MSGHSKWAQIKRQKGTADVKKGLTFTKISNAITIAVRSSAGVIDPDQNFRLRLAVEEARASNMPKDNIERAIQRAAGREGGALEEVVYEGFAPYGVSVIIEAATDNSQRTTSEIKSIFNKEGANFGKQGSVSYQFKHMRKIVVKKNGKSFDEIFEIGAESGAEDVEDKGEEVFIYSPVTDFSSLREKLLEKGLEISNLDLIRKPTILVPILDQEKFDKVISFLNRLEELDDVQKVYSNLELH